MAETIVELVARISADATELKKALAESENSIGATARKAETEVAKIAAALKQHNKEVADAYKNLGKVAAISGTAIVATMGIMGKSAIDEEINIKHLQIALKGVGISYDTVKDSLEKVITATQRKTGIADSEQRDTLSRLILVTKDYEKALKLLPLALDLAAYSQMNTSSAATYLAKAYEELEEGAEKIGIRMGTTTVYFKDLDEVQRMVGGTAEAMKNPFSVLKTVMGDLFETIGSLLVPAIKNLINIITQVVDKAQEWIKENPILAKSLSLVTLGTGLLLAGIGGLILLLPKLISSYKALVIISTTAKMSTMALLGSFTALLAGIGMVTYGLFYLSNQQEAYDKIKLAGMALDVQRDKYLKGEVNNYKELLTAYIPMLEAYLSVSNAKKEDIEAQREWIKVAKEGLTQLEENEVVNAKSIPTTKSITSAIEKLRESYGDLGDAVKSKADLAREASRQAQDDLDGELKASRRVFDAQMAYLSNLYDEKIRVLNAGASAAIKVIQDEIDAIDKKTQTEEHALEDQRDAEHKLQLEKDISTAIAKGDTVDIARARKDLADFIADVERKHLLDKREDEKDALRDSIDKIRTKAQEQEDAFRIELKGLEDNERDKLTIIETNIERTKILLDKALLTELARLGIELKEKENTEIGKLELTKNTLAKEEQAAIASHKEQVKEAQTYLADLQKLFSSVVLTTRHVIVTEGGGTIGGGGPVVNPGGGPVGVELQHGGIVTQPTMGLIGEAGPEAVVPLNEARGIGGITINFTQPVFFDREDDMNGFIMKIKHALQRQNRFSPIFG